MVSFDGGVWTWTLTSLISDVNPNLIGVGQYFALCADNQCNEISNFVQITQN